MGVFVFLESLCFWFFHFFQTVYSLFFSFFNVLLIWNCLKSPEDSGVRCLQQSILE